MYLARRQDSPVLFGVVRTIGLPQVVESGEQSSIITANGLDRRDGSALVRLGGDSNTIGVTLRWPASFSDENSLGTTTGSRDSLDLAKNPLTRVGSSDVTVEESVSVDSNVVRSVTQSWVVDNSNESVNGNNWTSVASVLQNRLRSRNIASDLAWVGLAGVDQFVTDGNGVNFTPTTVALNGRDQGVQTGLEVGDIEDTGKDLLVGSLVGQNSLDLVTVNTVKSDNVETRQLGQLRGDLRSGFTTTIVGVRRVSDTLGTSSTSRSSWGRSRRGGSTRRSSTGRHGSQSSWDHLRDVRRGWSHWSSQSGWAGTGGHNNVVGLSDNVHVFLAVAVVLVLDRSGNSHGYGGQSNEGLEQHGGEGTSC